MSIQSQEVMTLEQLDEMLRVYEKQNPEKFAAKMASGEFEKKRALLEKKEEVKRGRPKKEKEESNS